MVQFCSKLSGLAQKRGNWAKRVALSWLSSVWGRAGRSFHPRGVHLFKVESPKKASLANFTARILIFHKIATLKILGSPQLLVAAVRYLNEAIGHAPEQVAMVKVTATVVPAIAHAAGEMIGILLAH